MNMLKGLILVLTLMIPNTLYALELGTTKGTANYQTGIALSKVITQNGVKIHPVPHRGTNIYTERVNAGKLDFAIGGAYHLYWAKTGTGPVKYPHKNLRFVANLQNFRTTYAVRNNSNIKTYEDLAGKRVPSGFAGAPSFHWMMEANLANGGLTWDDVTPVPVASLPKCWAALQIGTIDACTFAVGSGSAKKFNILTPGGLRGLSSNLGQKEKDMFRNWKGVSIVTQNPSDNLPLIRGKTRVTQFSYQLFTNKNVPNVVVMGVVLALYKGGEDFQKSSGFTKSFKRENMNKNVTIPMHSGAKRAYDELGLAE